MHCRLFRSALLIPLRAAGVSARFSDDGKKIVVEAPGVNAFEFGSVVRFKVDGAERTLAGPRETVLEKSDPATVATPFGDAEAGEKPLTLEFAAAGLPAGKECAVFGFWENKVIARAKDSYTTQALAADLMSLCTFREPARPGDAGTLSV